MYHNHTPVISFITSIFMLNNNELNTYEIKRLLKVLTNTLIVIIMITGNQNGYILYS